MSGKKAEPGKGKIISLDEYELAFKRAKEVLSSGGVIVYPTDTLYGIGGDARNPEVVERICKIKKRGKEEPFSILLGNLEMVREYAECDGEREMVAIMNLLPGPVTLIMKAKKELPVAKEGKIGIRVPEHSFMRKLSAELKMPIITTSANRAGKEPPTSVEEVEPGILKEVDLIIDGGPTLYKKPSTIFDLVERKMKRKGAMSIER